MKSLIVSKWTFFHDTLSLYLCVGVGSRENNGRVNCQKLTQENLITFLIESPTSLSSYKLFLTSLSVYCLLSLSTHVLSELSCLRPCQCLYLFAQLRVSSYLNIHLILSHFRFCLLFLTFGACIWLDRREDLLKGAARSSTLPQVCSYVVLVGSTYLIFQKNET